MLPRPLATSLLLVTATAASAPSRPRGTLNGQVTHVRDGDTLRCELNGERTHDRCVGICYLEGADIAAELVAAGVARDWPRYK